MNRHEIVLIINLLQDINILRPLAYIGGNDLEKKVSFLITPFFTKRDKNDVWKKEIEAISKDINGSIKYYQNEFEALIFLENKTGIIITASESDLNAHKPVHNLFKIVPSNFLKVTIQHGFECVGFLQSKDQNLAHGKSISFAADIVCAWCEEIRLTSLLKSQRSKLYVAGPTSILQSNFEKNIRKSISRGIVCENMHSPRLNTAGDFKVEFISIFTDFCQSLKSDSRSIALRPHPGGQYVLNNNVPLLANVVMENEPIYKLDLSNYDYGISAPSSILIDMVLAKIPVAVWQDGSSIMDLGNYEGLTRVSSLDEWVRFSEEAIKKPEYFLKKQAIFLEKQKMITNLDNVYENYSKLLSMKPQKTTFHNSKVSERILYIANAFIPTLQLSFYKPLAPLVESRDIAIDLITEADIKQKLWKEEGFISLNEWLEARFSNFNPSMVVFCRYSGPRFNEMLNIADELGAISIYHIDDDLLNIPIDIGEEKYKFHNQPTRIKSVQTLLDEVDLIYCSTNKLKQRLIKIGIQTSITAGDIYCSSKVISHAENREVLKIGYMGIGHEKDMKIILPAIIKFMDKYPQVIFELFGSIPLPVELEKFNNRVQVAPKIDNYNEFLQKFSEFKWDIGICPLSLIDFNMVKANTKWIEYTTVGAAVIASKGTVYDYCCSDGCGILAATEDEWFLALEKLLKNPKERFLQVKLAQEKLKDEYSIEQLRNQVLSIFENAKINHINKVIGNIKRQKYSDSEIE